MDSSASLALPVQTFRPRLPWLSLILLLAIPGGCALMIQFAFQDLDETQSQQLGAKAQVDAIYQVCVEFERVHGRPPRSLIELCLPDGARGGRPWLESVDILDPWGNPLQLVLPAEFELESESGRSPHETPTPTLPEELDPPHSTREPNTLPAPPLSSPSARPRA